MANLHSSAPGEESTPDLTNDLRALRDESARDPLSLAQHVVTIRTRRLQAAQARRAGFMVIKESVKSRPWLASGVAVVVLAVAMLIIPISYTRTTGQQVALKLVGLSDSQLRAVAAQLKALLHSDHVALLTMSESGAPSYVLETFVPSASGLNAAMIAQAFAKSLSDRGYPATAVTTPVRERVSGSVYAYAKDLVIQVSTDGKTSAQIEAEIRQRLAEAGITDAQVSVTDEGGGRKVKLSVQRTAQAGQPQPPESNISLQLTKDGKPITGPGLMVEIKRTHTASGMTLTLDVTQAGKTTTIDVPHADTMTDAQIKAEVEARLRQAGIDARVSVTNGQIGIESNH